MVTGLPSLDALQQAFGYVESSNRYDAIGPRTRRGNNAYGRYQVMDFNVPSWTEQYFGRRLTPQQFLGNPQAQDAVFYGRMGEYYNRGQGTPEDRVRNAASLWFTGQPYSAETAGRSDGFINNQEYGDRILRALGSAPQGASTMSMNPDPQPQGLFGGIGQGLRNMFGGGQPDPNAGSATDPFEGLSRSQRTMLGFAALRDAAAALEGRDSSFFNEALGGFEAARERERLRAQGLFANQVQALQALSQIENQIAISQDYGIAPSPAQLRLRDMLYSSVYGDGGVAPASAPAGGTGGALPPPTDFTGGTMPPGAPSGPLGVTGAPETGVVIDPVTGETSAYDGAPETPPAPAAVDPLAELDARIAEAQGRARRIGARGGDPSIMQGEIDQLLQQREDLLTEMQTAETEAEAESRVTPLIGNAIDFLVNDDGSINVLGARIAGAAPGLAGGQARLAAAAVTELGAIAAMNGVREARAGGFGGALSDADILLIQRSGGTFDLSNPEATVETLRRLANQLSPGAQRALFGSQPSGTGGFTPSEEDAAILERYR